MSRHVASLFAPKTPPNVAALVEDCIKQIIHEMEEPFDMDVLLSRDKARIDTYMRSWINQHIDQHPDQFVAILKRHLMDELLYRLLARAYFD